MRTQIPRLFKLLVLILVGLAPFAATLAQAQSQPARSAQPLRRGFEGDLWADVIIGKPDFATISPYTTGPDKLFWPHGIVADRTVSPNRMYIYDAGNNRVLGFDLARCLGSPTDPANCSADLVIGQPNMTASACNGDSAFQGYPNRALAGPSTLCGQPENTLSVTETGSGSSMAVDGAGNLYLTDFFNHRVLKYVSPFTTDTVADEVWGQNDFTSNNCNKGGPPDATTLCFSWGRSNNWTAGVDVDGVGNLWVTDSGNNRVLRFPPGSRQADLVLGQDNFSSQAPGAEPNRLNAPAVVRVSGSGRVYVADQGNNRVLTYDPDFATGMEGREFGSDFWGPSGLDFDPTQPGVWIMNSHHNTLERWDEESGDLLETIGARGIGNLLGRATGSVGIDSAGNKYVAIGLGLHQNDVLMFTAGGSPTTPARRLFGPGLGNRRDASGLATGGGVAVANNQLIVADQGRVLFWNNPLSVANGQAADGVVQSPAFDGKAPGCCLTLKADNAGHLWVSLHYEGSLQSRIEVYALPLLHGALPIKTLSLPLPVLGGGELTFPGRIPPFWGLAPTPDGRFLWVSHADTNRVFRVRDPLGSPVVDVVLGQADAQGVACNRGEAMRVGARPDTLCAPGSLSLDRRGNLYVSDHALEIQGNMRLLVFAHELFPENVSTAIYAPAASKIFPNVATWEPAFDSANRMVVGYNPYWNFNPGDKGRFPGVYNDPLGPSTAPDALLNDYYSMAISATFDEHDNLYVGDWNRGRVLVYRRPFSTCGANCAPYRIPRWGGSPF